MIQQKNIDYIAPDWPAPAHIHALTTLRHSSERATLKERLHLPAEPIWLQQNHGTDVVEALPENRYCVADAAYTQQENQICTILTADCLPIFLSDTDGSQVALIHAGWRGLAAGIIKNTVDALPYRDKNLIAAFGPAIGPEAFEVGEEVRTLFMQKFPSSINCFKPSPQQRWLADLYALATMQLQQCGITRLFYSHNTCTFKNTDRFFSYRKEGKDTGRMISIIWKSRQVR